MFLLLHQPLNVRENYFFSDNNTVVLNLECCVDTEVKTWGYAQGTDIVFLISWKKSLFMWQDRESWRQFTVGKNIGKITKQIT